MNEKILCAAIWFDDGKTHAHQPVNIETGVVLCGYRHSCIFSQTMMLVRERKEFGMEERAQGFLTDQNRFVDRYEAAIIATEAKQLKAPLTKVEKLHSEDLY